MIQQLLDIQGKVKFHQGCIPNQEPQLQPIVGPELLNHLRLGNLLHWVQRQETVHAAAVAVMKIFYHWRMRESMIPDTWKTGTFKMGVCHEGRGGRSAHNRPYATILIQLHYCMMGLCSRVGRFLTTICAITHLCCILPLVNMSWLLSNPYAALRLPVFAALIGAPGTGKTTTAERMLRDILEYVSTAKDINDLFGFNDLITKVEAAQLRKANHQDDSGGELYKLLQLAINLQLQYR